MAAGLLIADDEDIVRSAVRTIVARSQMDLGPIHEAASGEEAVSLARQKQPQIVLMDVKMPGLNGLEAARSIRAENPKTKVVMLTAYDEFDFSQEALRLGAVDYLLKPIRPGNLLEVLERIQNQIKIEEMQLMEQEQVTSRLREALPLVEAGLVYDLVHGTVSAKAAAERISAHLEREIASPVVFVIDIDHFKSAVEGMDAEQFDQFCHLLNDIVRRVVPEPNRALIGQVRPGVIVVILSTEGGLDSPERLKTIGHTMRYAIEAGAPITATVGIGNSYPDLGMMPVSYSEAMRAQWYKLHFGRNSVIHINDVQQFRGEVQPYPVELEQELVASVRLGQRQASKDLMDRMVDILLSSPVDPPEMILTRFMELAILISRAMISAGAPTNEILEQAHRQVSALNGLKTGPQLRAWASDCLDMMMAKMQGTKRGNILVEQAVNYLHSRISQPGVELRDAAVAIHVSPSHLAHLIKEKTGMSYVKYLRLIRMEKAKKLLATTDKTIAAIALEVGYDNPTYFHRIFRRETTMTPSAYRQMTQKDSALWE
jgi:two-component system response regulator YesN